MSTNTIPRSKRTAPPAPPEGDSTAASSPPPGGSKPRRRRREDDGLVRAWGAQDKHLVRTYRTLQATLGPVIRLAFPTTLRPLRKIPKKGAVILAANHSSNLDPVLVMASLHRPVFHLAKHTLFTKPFRGWFFQTLGGQIPVRRDERGGNEAAIEASVKALEAGVALGIYPEAHRTKTGKLHRGRPGVGRIALLTGVPVFPVAIEGSQRVWPKGKKIPRPFRRVRFRVGDPLVYPRDPEAAADKAQCQRVADEIMIAIARLLGQDDYDPATAGWARP